MKRFLLSGCVALLMSAAAVLAQTYPDYESITVNDFAGLLPPEAEAEISAELDKLREDTGIEMTVVTLSRKDMFAPDQDLETFAAGLFDQWGIGDKDRNDGILFLVLLADRETRIELGKGYAGEWQFEANWIMEREILPQFKKENYVTGIRYGVETLIEKIARPFHAGAEPPKRKGGVSAWWLLLIFVPILLVGAVRNLKARLAKCPQCGARGVKTEDTTVEAATRTSEGRGEHVTDCPKCGYHGVESYTISRISSSRRSSSGSSFGGGSSGGGGASGKW
ncbi:TPM domain-containing protein [Marimonas arenosa]|uniref:TPM domain-containing protein n=1 Tax=Marimonas arenosa TaxID=1795305 RepID=A0AAE3W9G8_9RHOB|nr:TPM domain-containing protein [Marimonas arenosa]MDQ2088335.1 TPM domain-containing protein [Marimonas arenosa]